MIESFKRLASSEEGATMVEYALMVALIGAARVTVVTALGTTIGDKFTSVGTSISGS
jgi:pilus assembly protein Flp/PilA